MGRAIAHIEIIWFQERGYPLCHLLITYVDESKIGNPEGLDSSFSTEILELNNFQLVYEILTSCVTHRPFSNNIPNGAIWKMGLAQKICVAQHCWMSMVTLGIEESKMVGLCLKGIKKTLRIWQCTWGYT